MLNKLCRKGGVARVSAEDCVDDGVGEVVISDAVKVNIHPQETLSKSFNVFGSTWPLNINIVNFLFCLEVLFYINTNNNDVTLFIVTVILSYL